MKQMIRKWLGLDEMQTELELCKYNTIFAHDIACKIDEKLAKLNIKIDAHNLAIGQLISKLNPMYGIPEDDPARVEASRKLGEEVIKKLEAEATILRDPQVAP